MSVAESNEPFASGLRALIFEKGLKNLSIAQKAGYTAQELSDMLNGRKLIKACDVLRLSQALNVKSDKIYEAGKKGG
ncbi:XRE family transcriptional regulator [Lachnospiraceae bacterium 46-15]